MPNLSEVADFNELLSPSHFDNEGIDCTMKDGYFCFWMEDICAYYGIELEEIFGKQEDEK